MGGYPYAPSGGGGNGTPPPTSNGLTGLLQAILDFAKEIFGRNGSEPHIETVTLDTGATYQQMFPGTKGVKSAQIQNISTENVTIYTISAGQVASKGMLLTKANAAGEGGGSIPVGNVDLAKFWFVRTTAGLTLGVYSET